MVESGDLGLGSHEKHEDMWGRTKATSVNNFFVIMPPLSCDCTQCNGEKFHKCNKCEYSVSHGNTLKVHMKICRGDTQWKKVHKCNQCNFTMYRAINSRNYEERRKACATSVNMRWLIWGCMRKYTVNRNCIMVKPWRCNQCEYFSDKYLHSKEKPFECS